METLENALELLLSHTSSVKETEVLPLCDALGRIAAADVASRVNLPPFNRSPLDGYALHSEDIVTATREQPVRLTVIGEACAGCGTVFAPKPGEALRIMTGAPVPAACDCVIRQEDTNEGMDTVEIYAAVGHNQNICWAGEDLPEGTVVLKRGDRISPAHIGTLCGIGVTQVEVFRRPTAVLLCTGDELIEAGEELSFGKIYDSSKGYLTARMAELGIRTQVLSNVADEPQQAASALLESLQQADILITTGGVSVGKKDIMHQVLPMMEAERLFWKIAMKPGSPLLAATCQGKPMICLSGNPYAAIACFEIFARPVLAKLAGQSDFAPVRFRARLAQPFPKGGKVRRLARARFNGSELYFNSDNHSSGSISSMIGCNCLVDIPGGVGPLPVGTEVDVFKL